jgi:cobalt-zinc-cadmium efflux system outer membrane protein
MQAPKNTSFMIAILTLIASMVAIRAAAAPMGVDQIVDMAVELSPQVRAARARWESAKHSILQNYAPEDPFVGFSSLDSPTNGFTSASERTFEASASFQFPGKAFLQADIAKRSAEIARLSYEAMVRDIRTNAATAFYQLSLDEALKERVLKTISDLKEVAAATNQNQPKADAEAVAAQIAEEQQNLRRLDRARADDGIRLNTLLRRGPDDAIETDPRLEVEPIEERVEDLTDRAWHKRQEILQLALTSENAETGLKLAKLQYAPDYSIGYAFNHYVLDAAAPAPNLTQTHNLWIGFNLPLFFWIKQKEDVVRAGYELEAARDDLDGLRINTAAQVALLYRHARFDYEEALLYRNTIVPSREEVFHSALSAYRKNGEYLAELVQVRVQLREARSAFLQAASGLMQDRIALEQEIGEPLRANTH